jgi:hypothetical protein
MGRRARHVLIASALALTVSVAACATDEPAASKEFVAGTTLSVAGDTAAVGDQSACTPVDAPMLNIPTASDDEPRMRIPQPQGWERSTEFDNVDESVRFSLVNTDLVGDEAPDIAVVVTVEPAPDAVLRQASSAPGPTWCTSSTRRACRRTWRRLPAPCAGCPPGRSPTRAPT